MLYKALGLVGYCILYVLMVYVTLLVFIPVMYPEDSPALQFWMTAMHHHIMVILYLWKNPYVVLELLWIAWFLFLGRYFYNKYLR